jgi:hypothetical protein
MNKPVPGDSAGISSHLRDHIQELTDAPQLDCDQAQELTMFADSAQLRAEAEKRQARALLADAEQLEQMAKAAAGRATQKIEDCSSEETDTENSGPAGREA